MTIDKMAETFERMQSEPMPAAYEVGLRIAREGIEAVALHPGQVRRREHEELIAATLTAGILSNAKSGHTCAGAVRVYRDVLAEMRKPKPEYAE